jgi:hypothetical protein
MKLNHVVRATAAAVLSITTAAQALPIGVDGSIGAEWVGVTPSVVQHNPLTATSNFAAPGFEGELIGYSVYFRADATYIYGAVQANGDTGGNNWANLYFDTNNAASAGSDWGMEVTLNRAFKPGVAGYHSLAGYLTFEQSVGNVNHVIEWAMPWSYFQNDPHNILPNNTDLVAGIQLRLSQSYNYAVAGGPQGQLGTGLRFGTVSLVPEPTGIVLGLAALGVLGVASRRIKPRA